VEIHQQRDAVLWAWAPSADGLTGPKATRSPRKVEIMSGGGNDSLDTNSKAWA